MKKIHILIIAAVLGILAFTGAAQAAELSYTNPTPQTGDSELVIDHKTAVNIADLAVGNSWVNYAATGTNAVTTNACVLERIVIGKASADTASTVTLKTGTNTVATLSAASARVVDLNVRLSAGLTVILAGTNSPDVTVSWR